MDGSYRLLAARYVRKQVRQLLKQLGGAKDASDIEHVHQARVASRRLRAGLQVFPECFPRKKVERWRKKVRRLTQGLGPARDADVQAEFVRGVLAGLNGKAYRPGIARLLVRVEQSRRAIQPEVVRAVDRFEASGVGSQMLDAAEKMRARFKKRDLSVQSPFVFSQAADHVCDRLNELMGYEDCLAEPEDLEQHHAMRIAAKRLRYTLEIFQPVYQGRLDPFVKAMKGLQTLLGDVHDCDVWVEHLETFLGEERERTVVYYGHARPFRTLKVGLEYLQEERRSRRRELFAQLVGCWQDHDQAGLWEALLETVQSAMDAPAELEPPPPPQQTGNRRKPIDERSDGDGKPASDEGARARREPEARRTAELSRELTVELTVDPGPHARVGHGPTVGREPCSVGPDGRPAGARATLLGAGEPGVHGQ